MDAKLTAYQSRLLAGLGTVSVSTATGSAWDMQAKGGPRLVPARTFEALRRAGALVPSGADGGTEFYGPAKRVDMNP